MSGSVKSLPVAQGLQQTSQQHGTLEEKPKQGKAYKGFVAGVFSGIAKLSGMF